MLPRPDELAALRAAGVLSAAAQGWLEREIAAQQAAAERFDDVCGTSGLFGADSSSSSSSSDEESGQVILLPPQRWTEPHTGLSVAYTLASGSAYGHGDEVWAAAVCLAERLCASSGRAELLGANLAAEVPLQGLRVLELGAGGAIPSWVCAALGATTVASDYPSLGSVAAMLRGALENGYGEPPGPNLASAGRVSVVPHCWGESVAPLLAAPGREFDEDAAQGGGDLFDIVLACDCIYDPGSHAPLLRTLCATLRSASATTASPTAADKMGARLPRSCGLVAFSFHGNTADENIWAFFSLAEVSSSQPWVHCHSLD